MIQRAASFAWYVTMAWAPARFMDSIRRYCAFLCDAADSAPPAAFPPAPRPKAARKRPAAKSAAPAKKAAARRTRAPRAPKTDT